MSGVYSLEDVFLCEPITKRGNNSLKKICSADKSMQMDLNDFYGKIYEHPFFVDKEDKPSDDECNTVNNYNDDNYSSEVVNKINLQERKKNYENNFLSTDAEYLMFIRSSAGSGKSIYLNYLKWMRRKIFTPHIAGDTRIFGYNEELQEMCFDLENSVCQVQHGYTYFPSMTYKIPSRNIDTVDSPWHFFNMIIDSIFDVCHNILKNMNNDKKKNIETNFKLLYGLNRDMSVNNLFYFLCNTVVDTDNEYEVVSKLFDLIIKVCFVDPEDVSLCIVKALSTLTRFISIKSDLANPKQLLISFDNIEHFINNTKRIYDEDIEKITSAVVNFANLENDLYKKIKLNFVNFFKIVLVVRDTTSKMLSGDVHSKLSQDDCLVDVTGWFCLENIYQNKINYFNFKEESSLQLKFFNLIVSDSLSKIPINNLVSQISSMYNHNFRRTTRILTRIVAIFERNSKNKKSNGVMNFDQFHTLWSSDCNSYVTYLCRNAVMRFLYNEISATSYYNNICNNIENCTNEKNTYAMRILTWLSNQDSHITERYYSFYEIIREVLCSPEVKNCESGNLAIKEFAEVLVALDEHRFDNISSLKNTKTESYPNLWCQLLIIKYNTITPIQELDSIELAKTMSSHYDNKVLDDERYGIRLTEAGFSFIKNSCDFEYFACQYSKNNLPLLFVLNVDRIKIILDAVYTSAKKYIDNFLLFETAYFNKKYQIGYERSYYFRHVSPKGTINTLSIPHRIVSNHKFYLQQYKKFIENDNLQKTLDIFTTDDRKTIIKLLDEQYEKYQEIITNLENDTYKINNNIITGYVLKK